MVSGSVKGKLKGGIMAESKTVFVIQKQLIPQLNQFTVVN